MQILTTGENYSGIGPNSFNKRQLFEIIKMRQKAGRKTRTNLSIKNLDKTSRKTLVTEAKRVRTPYTWSELYSHSKVAQYSAV